LKNKSPHAYTIHHSPDSLMQAGQLLRRQYPDLAVSKRRLRQLEAIQMVRQKRENDAQNLGFSSRPFVFCGLPVKRPPTDPYPNSGSRSSTSRLNSITPANFSKGRMQILPGLDAQPRFFRTTASRP
jgi:hypothetical protein